MKTKIRVYNIVWDTDGEIESEIADLPVEVFIEIEGEYDDDTISDYLSDEYGYCHCGFMYEVVKE